MATRNLSKRAIGLKRSIRKRDGLACVNCDKTGMLTIHHLDGDSSRNEEDNMITLCPPCHTLFHYMEIIEGGYGYGYSENGNTHNP